LLASLLPCFLVCLLACFLIACFLIACLHACLLHSSVQPSIHSFLICLFINLSEGSGGGQVDYNAYDA
jgi:hypothetical protein